MVRMTLRLLHSSRLACITATWLLCATAWAQAGAACDPASTDVASTNACAVQRFQHTDSAHNILYSDVMRALSAHERPALRKDQTQWSRQRTSTCKTQHAHEEALPAWPQHYHDCLTTVTEQRRAALLHWLQHGQAPHS